MRRIGGRGPRRKGDQWNRDVVEYLRHEGLAVDRAYGAGRPDDVGDIDGLVGFHLECKAGHELKLPVWLAQACGAARQGTIPVVIVKRERQPVERAYVVLELKDAAQWWLR